VGWVGSIFKEKKERDRKKKKERREREKKIERVLSENFKRLRGTHRNPPNPP
jgi:hypothetical protein